MTALRMMVALVISGLLAEAGPPGSIPRPKMPPKTKIPVKTPANSNAAKGRPRTATPRRPTSTVRNRTTVGIAGVSRARIGTPRLRNGPITRLQPAQRGALRSRLKTALANRKSLEISNSNRPLRGRTFVVHEGRQGKHILGHNNYRSGRSILTANPSELVRSAGLGQPANNRVPGTPGYRERVDFKKPIGYYVDKNTKIRTITTKATIHHGSNDSVHIIPARP